nr:cytochrome c oxidase subunit 2 [Craspedonirmus immer]
MSFWVQLSLQDSWSPLMTHISSFHDHAMVVVIMIVSVIMYIILSLSFYPGFDRKITELESLEVVWTLFPGVVLGFLAIPSLHSLYLLDEVSNPSISIKAVGHQWYWSYEYTNFSDIEFDSFMSQSDGCESFRLLEVDSNTVVPVSQELRVVVSSADVIHSWALPSLGVKMDAIPGRLNQVCLYLNRSGLVYGMCSEICGAMHSFMPICIEAVTLDGFVSWLKSSLINFGYSRNLLVYPIWSVCFYSFGSVKHANCII